MKQTTSKPEFEGPFYDDRGRLHIDTGDIWHRDMPQQLWIAEARALFQAAKEAGLIQPHPYTEGWTTGEGMTKPQLAYWCKKASTYLHLDYGEMQKTGKGRTNWKVFDQAFICHKPLKGCLHDIAEATNPEQYTAVIDQFFSGLNDK